MAGNQAAPALRGLFWSAPLGASPEFVTVEPLALDCLAQQIGNRRSRGFLSRSSRAGYYLVVPFGLDAAERALANRPRIAIDEIGEPNSERFEWL